jgi:hypothetical protein
MEGMEKQTAVEWLAKNLKDFPHIKHSQLFRDLIKQAKEMEKEQLYNLVDFINERHFNSFRISKDEVEQYYNKTFKSE